MEGIGRTARIAVVTGMSAAALRLLRRRRVDPAHAPGKRHRPPAPPVDDLASGPQRAGRDQPWVRRSHSDSQQRRFRR